MRRFTLVLFALCPLIFVVPRTATAQGPCTGEYRQFDFWIGEWDILNRNRPTDESRWYDTGGATDRVYPVAGGCGIVEHWRGHAYGEFLVGFSLRAFNPTTGQWDLVLLWPSDGQPRFGELRGGFRHNRGEFYSRGITAEGDTTFTRFTFSDITSETVMWQDGNSADGGRSWASTWIMEFTRRDLLYQGPLLNGPSVTNLRCPAEEHRSLDFLLGEWAGMSPETASEDQGEEVRAQVHPILEGCAVMERVQAVGQSSAWEVFRVRTFETSRQRWVEYRLDTRHPVIQRLEAERPAAGSPWVFESPGDVRADGDLRVTLTQTSDGGLSWTEERWNQEGAQWQLQPGVRYRERLGSVAAGG
jgi:hypothetical protein